MKILLDWLADYIDLNQGVGVAELMDGLVQLGHEVEGVDDQGKHFANVVIGKVLERVPHPNADRLGVCTVDVGEKEPRTIVCGAPNARKGITVAVALPGAVLPGDFKIAKSDKRGVASDGMICSVRELGLGDEHEGIWEMDTKAATGTPLANVVKPSVVLDVGVTPNRGDCLSHYGMARDLAALGIGKLKKLSDGWEGSAKPTKSVATASKNCSYIGGIEVKGVKAVASPAWLAQRLMAVGVKPRNILVDATNYVMLAVGQPLHAYDADKLKDGICAADGFAGIFEGLLGDSYELGAGDVVIRDGAKGEVVGLGGILGGAGTAVSEATSNVLIEGAWFDRVQISLTGQKLGLFTDARSRFERGVDPSLTALAGKLCAQIIAEGCGLTKSAVSKHVHDGKVPAHGEVIAYDPAFFEEFIGLAVDEKRQKAILESLGFAVKTSKKGWEVTAPVGRTYMSTPEDITEEILRVVGYENVVPVEPTVLPGQHQVDSKPVELDRMARKALALAGLTEVMTYSFIRSADAALVEGEHVVLDNPLVDTMQVMRPSLLPGLVRALNDNVARKETVLALGEVGKIFDAKLGERLSAAGVVAGSAARHWRVKAEAADVFVAKGMGEAVLETLGAPVGSARVVASAGALYHPGKSGVWQVGPMVLGRFGELHPAVLKALDVDVPVAVFELDAQVLLKLKNKARPFAANPYPPVARDVAFVVDKVVTAEALRNAVLKAAKELVQDVEIFDVYAGKGIAEGKKSIALGMTLQAVDRTLTQAEIDSAVANVVAAAEKEFGAILRG